MSADTRDKNAADLTEQIIKAASTVGVPGFITAFCTPAEYAPSGSTVGRDVNRATVVALFEILRTLPMRLPVVTVAALPDAGANAGSVVYCSNGAAGSPCLAFCTGSAWLRADNNSAVSAT